jgi:hypothetical protein
MQEQRDARPGFGHLPFAERADGHAGCLFIVQERFHPIGILGRAVIAEEVGRHLPGPGVGCAEKFRQYRRARLRAHPLRLLFGQDGDHDVFDVDALHQGPQRVGAAGGQLVAGGRLPGPLPGRGGVPHRLIHQVIQRCRPGFEFLRARPARQQEEHQPRMRAKEPGYRAGELESGPDHKRLTVRGRR